MMPLLAPSTRDFQPLLQLAATARHFRMERHGKDQLRFVQIWWGQTALHPREGPPREEVGGGGNPRPVALGEEEQLKVSACSAKIGCPRVAGTGNLSSRVH